MPSSFARPRQTAHCLADGESLMDFAVLAEERLMRNAAPVPWAQQSDSVLLTHMPALLQSLYPHRLFEKIE